MSMERRTHRSLCAFVGAILALMVTSAACAGNFTVIANKDVPDSALSKHDLQAVFLGEKAKWSNNRYIKVVLPEDESLLKSFLQEVLHQTPAQFDNHWSKLVYSGRAVMPQSIAEIPKLVDFVGKRSGAISVIPAGQPLGTAKTISIK